MKSNYEIQTLFEKGKRIRGENFDIIFNKNNLSHGRAGIVVGKKCGGAVDRNYIKRIFREIIYNQQIRFNFPFDFIVIPKSESKNKLFALLKQEVIFSIHKMLKQFSIQ
ncbi:MAG: ribonuclease P protein component [Nitrospiria bacterium]